MESFSFITKTPLDAFLALNECEEYCSNVQNCWGCSIDCETADCQYNAITDCKVEEKWDGGIKWDISQKPGKELSQSTILFFSKNEKKYLDFTKNYLYLLVSVS